MAVFSDIHAGQAAHGDTFVHTEPPESRLHENPLKDLIAFASTGTVSADLVVCPGDLTNRADSVGKVYGWNALQTVAASVGAAALVGSAGNHDLVTREPVADPSAALQGLLPSFPTTNAATNAEYWSQGFYIHEISDQVRLVNINSCHDFSPYPSGSVLQEVIEAHLLSVERGTVTDSVLQQLEQRLSALVEKPVNILLMHHHPREHARRHLFKDRYGAAKNGDELIDVLERASNCGRWFVIHGHKHIPDFVVDGSSARSPIILCAASVGGKLWQPIASVARNQFHLIEFDLDSSATLAATRGRVKSFAWSFGSGWNPAAPTTGLPAEFGFGNLLDPGVLAKAVKSIIDDSDVEYMRWDSLLAGEEALGYLGPRDLILFEQTLHMMGLVVERRPDFSIATIARSAKWT